MADRPRDFTSGTLYAAKLTQETSGDLGGTFGIEWIDLGHATSEEIEEFKNDKEAILVANAAMLFFAGFDTQGFYQK